MLQGSQILLSGTFINALIKASWLLRADGRGDACTWAWNGEEGEASLSQSGAGAPVHVMKSGASWFSEDGYKTRRVFSCLAWKCSQLS